MNQANETVKMERRIVALLRDKGPQSCQAIADALEANPFVIHGWMTTLLSEGRIGRSGGLYLIPAGPGGGRAA